MDKKLIVKQNGLKDCGPSCLLSIMKYYGVEASHEEVSFILKTNINGTNALNIIIPELQNRGYTFVTVSELFYYKEVNLEKGKVYGYAK